MPTATLDQVSQKDHLVFQEAQETAIERCLGVRANPVGSLVQISICEISDPIRTKVSEQLSTEISGSTVTISFRLALCRQEGPLYLRRLIYSLDLATGAIAIVVEGQRIAQIAQILPVTQVSFLG